MIVDVYPVPTYAGELLGCRIKIVFGLHPVAPEIGESPSFRKSKCVL
jgi:hypothetical protein